MVIIATTVAVSIAVCWKMGKFKSLPFHLQRNLAYRSHGVSAENMAFRGVTASGGYSYPMVDVVAHETTPADAPIITESNKAYGSRNATRQSINEAVRPDPNTQVPTDKIVPIGTCAPETFHDQQVEQSDIYAMPTKAVATEEENLASIEYCYVTSEEDQQHTDVAFYDSICAITNFNDSGTFDTKYDYILD